MLSRLPKIGFTNGILVKRILQWRRMGLDVSELEPALNYNVEDSYALYSIIEEKVRRVVELENRVSRLAGGGGSNNQSGSHSNYY